MSLSTDLISQFVKNTKDEIKPNKEVATYGTVSIKEVNGENKTYVTLDGSEIPIEVNDLQRTVTVVDKDRVSVTIKNHTVCITGNITDHSVSTSDNNAIIDRVQILVSDKVSTDQLAAEQARIEKLETDYVSVSGQLSANTAKISALEATDATITGKLTAAEADISNLKVDKLDAKTASVTYATIKNLDAAQADIYSLRSEYATFTQTTTGRLTAVEADIAELYAGTLTATEAEVIRADIKDLDAEVANIDTLIFGSATGDTIQTSFSNAVIAQLGDAQIKSAMIESVAASKITAGDIITNNVRVKSEDGSLIISDETMQISDETRVRVQIGKDASGDYSINVWDADGNLMFSKGGISDSAIKDKIIRDDMVSDTANIAAHKLDIDSLFEEINGSTNTIKSTQVKLDEEGQTLDVAFKSLSDTVTEQGTTITSQGTQITAIQGQITSKIWQQDIDAAVDDIEIGGRNLYIVKDAVDGYLSSNGDGTLTSSGLTNEKTSDFIPVTVGDDMCFQIWVTTPSSSYIWYAYQFFNEDKTNLDTNRPAWHLYDTTDGAYHAVCDPIVVPDGAAYIRVSARMFDDGKIKVERGNKPTDWTPAQEDIDNDITNLSTRYSEIEQTVNSISTTVAEHTTEIAGKAESSAVTEVNDKVTTLEQNLDGFKTTVSSTYATIDTVNGIEIGGRNLYIIKNSEEGFLLVGDDSLGAVNGIRKERTSEYVPIQEGDTYIFQVWATIDYTDTEDPNLWLAYDFYDSDKTLLTNRPAKRSQNKLPNGQCYDFYELNVPAGVAYVRISARMYSDGLMKLEKGNKATGWSPAPEDVENDISENKSSIVQLSDQITANVTETDSLGTRMTTVEQTADSLTVKMDSLEFDNTNLYVGTASFVSDKWINAFNFPVDGADSNGNARRKQMQWAGLYQTFKVYAGEVYTLSANVVGDGTSDLRAYSNLYDSDPSQGGTAIAGCITPADIKYGVLDTTETRVQATFTVLEDGYIRVRFENSIADSYVWISSMKLEKGPHATTWTPAPEDVDSDISDAAKTATNYLNFSSSGLVVGDMTASTLGKNVLIDSDSVDVREGTTTLASFGADTIYLGKNSETAVINLCNGSATMKSVDDTNFQIYTDKRLVMKAYDTLLLDCWRDSTHQTRISMQSADPDASYIWGGISAWLYQDSIENTFDMSGNTTEFKITDGTNESLVYLDETKLKIQASNTQINCTNGLYVGYDGDYAAKVTLGYDYLQDKAVRWFWSDNALHDGISNNNGQATYLGPGDIDEATTTYVRGKYVRLYGHTGGGVYLGTSGTTAVTSDRNLKTDILDLDNKYIDFFDRLRPITYKYNDGHRDHVGFIAQEVEDALIASGLTTEEFAGLVIEEDVTLNPNYDSSMTEEEKLANETHYDTLYSLRYEEFISLLVKKVQSLQEQINQLRAVV